MRQRDIQYIPIDAVADFVTNVPQSELSSGFGLKTRGFRHIRPGSVGERDFGTIQREGLWPQDSNSNPINIFDGFTLYVPSEDKEYEIIVGLDSGNNMRIYVDDGTAVGNWTELTTMFTATVNGTPTSVSYHCSINNTKDILGNAVTFAGSDNPAGGDQLANYVVKNVTRGNSAIITANTSSLLDCAGMSTFSGPVLGSSGLGWQNGDTLNIFMCTGIMDGYVFQNGTAPHVRWLVQEQLNKVTMLYGTGGSSITPQRPITIRKSVYSVFSDGSSSYVSTASGWYIDRMQTTCAFGSNGTQTAPLIQTAGNFTNTIGEGMKIAVSSIGYDTISGGGYHSRYYVTAVYRGIAPGAFYEESDPFWQLFISPIGVSSAFIKFTLAIELDLSILPKNLCGFRVYEAAILGGDIANNLNNWPDNPADYVLISQFVFDTGVSGDLNGWTPSRLSTSPYSYIYTIAIASTAYQTGSTPITGYIPGLGYITNQIRIAQISIMGGSVLSNIGHTPSNPQSYLKPRFAAKINRDQSSLVIYDQDNVTLRLSSFSGAAVNMDDNLPNVSTDAVGNAQLISLSLRGQMMGVGIYPTSRIVAFSDSGEMEIYDVYSGKHDFLAVDCVARRSIIGVGLSDAPTGLVWGGKSGIYFLPRDGSGLRLINFNWQNFYDGTLLTTDGVTPYVNDTFRKAMIAGYEPTYQEAWFHLQVAQETPNLVTVTGATTGPPIVIQTATPHSFVAGQLVYIQNVIGNGAANGTFVVGTVSDSTHFSLKDPNTLNDVTGTGAFGLNNQNPATAFATEYIVFRYNFGNNRYSTRKFKLGSNGTKPIRYFSRKRDNTITIGYSEALVLYPNRNSQLLNYQDDVFIATDGYGNIMSVSSRSNGIETILRINLGRLYSLVPNSVVREFLLDHSGSSVDLGDLLSLNFYFNGESISSDQTAFPVNFKCPPIPISSTVGVVEKAVLEFVIPTSKLIDFENLELKKIQVGYVPKARLGNN